MFEIKIQTHFSSAHNLREYDGDCSRCHGHNWIVEAVIGTETLDSRGIGIDFRDVRRCLERVLSDFDHRNLNDVPPFDRTNPTSENIARHIYLRLGEELGSVGGHAAKVASISVSETPGAGATYFEGRSRA